jgi:4-aminobutyrate aminotransferase-like enzyme
MTSRPDTATDAPTPTHAERLHADPRVRQARSLLREALLEHQAAITDVRAAEPSRAAGYAALLEEFGGLRGGGLFWPYLGSGLGHGPFVELADGSVKLDFITGIGVHGQGHSHPALLDAGVDAALGNAVMQGNLMQNPESADVCRALVELAGEHPNCDEASGLTHCFLSTSGAMANENAFKVLFQRRAPANRALAFQGCFMGRSMAMAWTTDKAANRVGVPKAVDVDYVPFYDPDKPDSSTRHSLAVLRRHLARYPGQHAFMAFELVQGEGGYYVGPPEFYRALMTECHTHGVSVFVDEVQSFGRLTHPFAFAHFGLDDLVDVVTVGKITQVCATLFGDDHKPKPGLLSQTFTGGTHSLLAARAILHEMREGTAPGGGAYFGADGRTMRLGAHFRSHLERLAAKHPDRVAGPFGIGSMVAFTPLGGEPAKVKRLMGRLYELGLLSFVAGKAPMRLRFLPPLLATTDAHIDRAAALLEQGLADVAAEPAA